MNRQAKIVYIAFLALITAAAAMIAFRSGYKMRTTNLARERIHEDIADLNTNISIMESEKKSALAEIESLKSSVSEQSFLNDQIAENRRLYMELTKNIDEKNQTLTQLDSKIQEQNDALKKLDAISVKEVGKAESLDPKSTYSCPKDFEKGFYKATGYGTLLIYSVTNNLRVSENLAALDTHSFVFNLEENERIKIDEETEIVKLE